MMNKYRVLNLSIPRHQSGVVLIISLIMLLALTLIGITSSSVTGLEEKMAANNKDINLAFQAAEAALRAAETSLGNAKPSSVNYNNRPAVLANQGVGGGAGYYTLLSQPSLPPTNNIQTDNPTPLTPVQTPAFYTGYSSSCTHCVNWGSTQQSPSQSSPQNSIVYSGTTLSGVYNQPEYIIEELANVGNTATSSSGGGKGMGGGSDTDLTANVAGSTITFRITAHGWGNSANSVANVQSIVKVTY